MRSLRMPNLHSSSSKYKGAYFVGANRWRAAIRIGGKLLWLGTYGFESDAAIAYNYHAAYFHGDFAKFNRVPIEEYMHD
jgi:hypothetical protein